MALVRVGKRKVRGAGFLLTWDIDSRDHTAVNRMQYFLFGRKDRQRAEPAGLVWRQGVRYLAQSAIFVTRPHLAKVEEFLLINGIDFDVDEVIFP